MNSRERVLSSLDHRNPDMTPLDLGSSNISSIHLHTYKRLLQYFGIEDNNIQMMDYASQLVVPCEKLLQQLQIDTRGIWLSSPKLKNTIIKSKNEYIDAWKVTYRKPENGLYFDVVNSPLENMETLDEVKEYCFPTLEKLASDSGVEERAKWLRQNTDYAIVGSFGSSIFMKAQQIRGYSKILEDLIIDQDIANYLMDAILDLRIQLVKSLINACGPYLDVIEMADDISGQDSLLISLPLYRQMIKPRTKKLIDFIKNNSNAKIMYHSCGNVYPLIEDFIEMGIDILNPVQVSAKDMSDLSRLKKMFGDRIGFWGAIDSQRLLPSASPKEVTRAVRDTMNILGKSGGYVLCASHNLQADVPIENIVAMYQTARK